MSAVKFSPAPPPRHEAQKSAADPRASVWVNASAGTGKTRVLVDRVLRLLLAGVKPWKILCLTYTKAAAAEMATRLSDELGAWAVMEDAALSDAIFALNGERAEPEVLAFARTLFALLLDAPGGLQISTVHSFCQSLLARFPLEAGVAPGFAVLDDRLSGALLNEAEREMLTAPPVMVAEAIEALLQRYSRQDFTGLLRAAVTHRVRLGAMFAAYGGPLGAVEHLRAAVLDLPKGATAETLLEAFASGPAREKIRGAMQVMAGSDKVTNTEHAAILFTWLETRSNYAELRKIFVKDDDTARSAAKIITTKLAEKHPEAQDALLAEQENVFVLEKAIAGVEVLARTGAFLTVAADLLGRYERLKRGRLALDYDDLIAKAARLVESGAPWVMFKLDGGIDHILVDEAQDSNPAQWRIVEALAGEYFSGQGAREEERTLFAVGDFKQSIYRFQGAEPQAFLDARLRVQEKATAAKKDFKNEKLNISFRSTEAVLQTVDKVFEPLELEVDMRHVAARKGMSGRVELWPLLEPDEDKETIDFESTAGGQESPAPAVMAARVLAARIKAWVGAEELKARGRKMKYGDVLVLVQRRGAFVEAFIREAKQAGVPVSGVDRMKILEQLAVEDMLALADFLLLPEDDLTLAAVLKGPLIGMSEQELYDLAYARSGTLWSNLKGAARDYLGALLARADFVTPHAFFSSVLANNCPAGMSGRKAMLTRLGLDAADPLDELLTAALQFENDAAPTLSGFLGWLRAGESVIKRELEQAGGQVRVMTVHGSKGLEAPVVILADAAAGSGGRRDSQLFFDEDEDAPPMLADGVASYAGTPWVRLRELRDEADEREYQRLLYVALTRAQDRLYVVGWRGKNSAPAGNWHELVAAGLGKIAAPAAFDAWAGEALVYESKQDVPPKADKDVSAAKSAETKLDGWAYRPAPAEPRPSRPLTPSRPDEAEPSVVSPLLGEDGSRFKRGLLIHRLLQTLPELEESKRRKAGLKWLGDEPNAEAIVDEVLAVITHPVLFGPQSRAEAPITGVVGEKVISGQIDRLAVTEDAVWVVDYKTNRPPPAVAEAVSPAYLRQLALYRAVLERVYPGKLVKAFLLWTYGPVFMEIPAGLLDAHAPNAHI